MPKTADNRKVIMIAGPNGAGKTTFAQTFLAAEAQCPHFINADMIALGLTSMSPQAAALRAGRLMLEEIRDCIDQGGSFAIETTLSGLSYQKQIRKWQRHGYHVTLFFLSLPTADMAVARVAERVTQGGHNIEEPVIRRRFEAGRYNFEHHYRTMVNAWALYDNSAKEPELKQWGENS